MEQAEEKSVSPCWKDKYLAGINQVGIADLRPVCLVNYGVAGARTVREVAEAPEAVAAGADRAEGRWLLLADILEKVFLGL